MTVAHLRLDDSLIRLMRWACGSLDELLQHLLAQRQVRHDPLQPSILFLELAQALPLQGQQPGALLAPVIEGRIADAGLPADLQNRRSLLSLAQDEGASHASVNFDFFMSKTPSAARAAKLQFSRKWAVGKPEAGQAASVARHAGPRFPWLAHRFQRALPVWRKRDGRFSKKRRRDAIKG